MGIEIINAGKAANINFIESDKFKSNHIAVNFICELDEKYASKNSLLIQTLKRGSKTYPTMQDLKRRLNYLYASSLGCSSYKMGEMQILSFSVYCLDDKYALDDTKILSEAAKVLKDVIFNPLIEDGGFKKDYVETEKVNLIKDIKSLINNKAGYTMTKCYEKMCADEKYSVYNNGKVELVEQLDGAALYEHYKYILETSAVEIYFMGDVKDNRQAVLDEFGSVFSSLDRSGVKHYDTEIIRKAEYKGEFVEEMEVNQGKLSIGFRTGVINQDAEFPAFVLFNALYGSSTTSKLFMNVREKLSLCYYCSSAPDLIKGTMLVNCGIEVENKEKAQDEILKQLEDVKNGVFDEKELEDARMSIINRYREIEDDIGGTEHWYFSRKLAGQKTTPAEFIALIENVTKEQVIAAANQVSLEAVYFLKGTIKGGEGSDE